MNEALQRWREDFAREPDTAFDRLVRGLVPLGGASQLSFGEILDALFEPGDAALDTAAAAWLKKHLLSPLPENSTKARQITRFHLPNQTSTRGLREMEAKDLDAVHDLLTRYLKRFEIYPEFNKEEIKHWFIHEDLPGKERVIWAYVVEDPATGKITDMFSFYSLESSVINNKKHDTIRAAYLFYYASETAFTGTRADLKVRLNHLINDALILAKKVCICPPTTIETWH